MGNKYQWQVIKIVHCTMYIMYISVREYLYYNETATWIKNFGWAKKNLRERDLNLRPPDWCAGPLPTELTSPILAVSLFCQYLCLGEGGGAPIRSHSEAIHPYTALYPGITPTTWEEAVRGCTIWGYYPLVPPENGTLVTPLLITIQKGLGM